MIHIIYYNISYTINTPDRHGHDDIIAAILYLYNIVHHMTPILHFPAHKKQGFRPVLLLYLFYYKQFLML